MYISINGWDEKNIPGFLKNAGTRISSGSCNDSDAMKTDPRRINKMIPARISNNGKNTPTIRKPIALLITGIYAMATQMRNKDSCVIVGRDMYPAQAIMQEWSHKLRGNWYYLEGASREVASSVRQSKIICRINNTVDHYDVHTPLAYCMDTGFSGSIPEMLCMKKALLSSNRKYDSVFVQTNGMPIPPEETYTLVNNLEHLPKPFLRSVEVTDAGMPVLRMSSWDDIQASERIMNYTRRAARMLLPLLVEALKIKMSNLAFYNEVKKAMKGMELGVVPV